MHGISTNQIADVFHANDNLKYDWLGVRTVQSELLLNNVLNKISTTHNA